MKKLEIKEKAFNALFENSGYISIFLSTTGSILDFNHAAEEFYGWRTKNVRNKNFFELCKLHNYPTPITSPDEMLPGEFKKIEATFNKEKQISIRWDISVLTNEREEKIFFLLGNNITTYKASEIDFKNTNTYLKNIVNNLPYFLAWKDINSVFLGCNKKFSDSVGLESPQDVIGMTDYDFPWTDEQKENYRTDDREIIRTGKAKLNYEELQTQSDGSVRVMLVSKTPIFDEKRKISGLLFICTDITERKELEENLRKAKEEAEKANELKMEFIRNMHHDIRTPLSGMVGLPKILMEMEKSEDKKLLLEKLGSCATGLLKYCDEILDFSKFISSNMPLLKNKFNLYEMLDELIDIQTPVAVLHELKLNMTCKENVPEIIIGDNIRLYRILINLISNAIKFTPTGYVNVVVEAAFMDKITKSVILKFIIEDSGIGIPKHKQTMIFEKFYRVEPSNTGRYKGFGLGLHEVKKNIEDMQGELDLYSEEGQGTTFICTIPFKLPLVED